MLSRAENPNLSHQVIHVILKNVGKPRPGDRYFMNQKLKQRFQEQLFRFLGIYQAIKLVSYCVMDSHVHCIFRCDRDYLSTRSGVAQSYFTCYGKEIDPNGEKCRELQKHLNDISKFVQRFAKDFTTNFNKEMRKNGYKRTGALWVPRFFSSELNQEKSLINCWIYNMLNPVRARMVDDPLQYKFSSLNLTDDKIREQVDHNFYQTYCLLTGSKLGFAEFKEKMLMLLKKELLILLAEFELISPEYLDLQLALTNGFEISQMTELVPANLPDS